MSLCALFIGLACTKQNYFLPRVRDLIPTFNLPQGRFGHLEHLAKSYERFCHMPCGYARSNVQFFICLKVKVPKSPQHDMGGAVAQW